MISIYSSKAWGSLNVRKTVNVWGMLLKLLLLFIIQYFIEECVVGVVRKCFVNDFLQLTYNLSTAFFLWYRCVIVITFPKNLFFYFHIEISLDIGHKMNVHKTYVRSIYVLFPGRYMEASKPVLRSKSH